MDQKKQDKPIDPKAEAKEHSKSEHKEQKPQCDPKEMKIQELTNLCKKIQADFENYKKREERERAEFCKYASCDFIKKMLPLLDSFQLALQNHDTAEFKKGVELIYSQLWQILETEGLKPINAFGKKFDPFLHEVLLQEISDKPEMTVLEELQKGYMIKEVVLRPARVKVAKNGAKK